MADNGEISDRPTDGWMTCGYHSVVVMKHYGQKHIMEEGIILAYGSRRVKIHHGLKTWQYKWQKCQHQREVESRHLETQHKAEGVNWK